MRMKMKKRVMVEEKKKYIRVISESWITQKFDFSITKNTSENSA